MTDPTLADIARVAGWLPLVLMLLGALVVGCWLVPVAITLLAEVLADLWRVVRGRP